MSLAETITAPAISAAASGFLGRAPHGHLIGGVWQAGGDTFDTFDPATGDVLALSRSVMQAQSTARWQRHAARWKMAHGPR
jgi:hypothetical protein